MTKEAIKYFKFQRKIFCDEYLKICPKDSIAYQATLKEKEFYNMAIQALEQEPDTEQFAKWVAKEIFDDNWEYNKETFAELACRKLAKLGMVIRMGDEWELVEPQESEEI